MHIQNDKKSSKMTATFLKSRRFSYNKSQTLTYRNIDHLCIACLLAFSSIIATINYSSSFRIIKETADAYSILTDSIAKIAISSIGLDIFGIDKVVISGNEFLPEKQILDKIFSMSKNGKIPSNLHNIRSAILETPLISDVKVYRDVKGKTLKIEIVESNIIAHLKTDNPDIYALIDENGNAIYSPAKLEHWKKEVPKGFLVQGNAGSQEVVELYLILKSHSLTSFLSMAQMMSTNRWNLIFKNGITFMLPKKRLEESIGLIKMMHESLDILEKKHKVSYIDLRIPGNIFVKKLKNSK